MVTTMAFFDTATFTCSYVVYDANSRDAVLIDPVLDYDPMSLTISKTSIKLLENYINQQQLNLRLILDTHVHADHMSGAFFTKKIFNIPSAIGENF